VTLEGISNMGEEQRGPESEVMMLIQVVNHSGREKCGNTTVSRTVLAIIGKVKIY
jgi:hypothetical protein